MTNVMTWLQEARKLDGAMLAHMGVKQVQHPQIGEAVAFAYRHNGEPYAAKFRTVDKQFRSSHGVSRGMYNADCLKRDHEQPIVITEGEIDCLSVIQAGYSRAVSLPDGWSEKGDKTADLVAIEADLLNAPWVIIAGDNDEAGASLPRTVATLLSGQDVRYAKWPDGCKDANDVLVLLGEGALSQAINEAVRIDPPGGVITSISDMPPMSARRVLRAGMTPFDYAVALELGAMSIWTGVPGSGKSTFLTFIADRIAINEDVRVGMMAFETHPHQTRDQLSRIWTGCGFEDLSEERQKSFMGKVDAHWRIVHRTFDDGAHALGWLESMVRTLALREGCKIIIVDPWNELEHLPEPGESMTAYINFALQRIRQLAEQYEVHIALVAHPKKMPTEGYQRAPTGYDVADSAAFYNKPSLGMTVHQHDPKDADDEPYVGLHIWKVRNTQLYGFQKGTVRCRFDMETMSYERMPKTSSTLETAQ